MRTLYIDLDNVLADFHKAASTELGVKITTDYKISASEWSKLDPRIYRNLDLTTDATELFLLCTATAVRLGCRIAILTAIPRPYTMPYATMDKIEWVRAHFPDVDVFIGPYTRDKVYHCKPGDILIDDNSLTIREWNAANGVGIHYTCLTDEIRNTLAFLK